MPWPLTLLVANNVSRSVVLRRTNSVVVGRIFTVPTAPGPPLDVCERSLGGHGQASRARLRGDARNCNGGVR
jgi:hypothetical protein